MLIFAASFVLLLICETKADSPIVKTPLGKVKGVLRDSHGGRQYSAFEGIPYAKPPVGPRRFEAPEPIEPWDGIWDSRFPTVCAQHINFQETNVTMGAEDCLHINVYVPREKPSANFDLEVLVHIHGGAFMMGDGIFYTHPQFIMDHEVIFVNFNYRLGILGFLSTEDDVVPGNMGMKDQVLALQWVQKNIRSFGGNPKAVTISGLSAGGASVHLHYFSDLSKNLFHRGMAHSGVALNSWVLTENSLEKAKTLAKAVGCSKTLNKDMINCLKERPVGQLLEKVVSFYGFGNLPITPFGPVVEKGENPFLKDQPYKLLKTKQVLDVPLLASHATHEGMLPAAFFVNDLETIDERWLEIAPILLDFNYTLPASKWSAVSKKIKDHYFGEDQSITKEQMPKLIEMFGDRLFYVGAEEALLLQAAAVKSPIYYYMFGYLGDNNEEQKVAHGGDSKYFFGQHFPVPADLTPNELKMKDIMIELLIAYTKTGVPSLRGIIWPFVEGDKLNHVEIMGLEGKTFKIRKPTKMFPTEFWNSLDFAENKNLLTLKDEL